MMNLLSQLIQKSGAQGLTAKQVEVSDTAGSEEQEKTPRFAQLVMGLLGMNSQNSEVTASLQDGEKTKAGIPQQSDTAKNSQTEKGGGEVNLGLFVGETVSQEANLVGTQGATNQAELQKHGNLSKNPNTVTEGARKTPSQLMPHADGDGSKTEKQQPTSKLTGNKAQQNVQSGQAGRQLLDGIVGEASRNGKGGSAVAEAGISTKKSIQETEAWSNTRTSQPSTLKNSGRQAGSVPKGPFKASPADSVQSIFSALQKEGEVQLEMAQNKNTQPKTFVKGNSTTQKGTANAPKPAQPVQHDPALRHLIQQATDKEHKTVLKESRLPSSGKTKWEATKASTSSGRSLNVNTSVVQSFAATQQDKFLFKPLQQSSASFELDPSKLMKIESGNTQELEMELQAQAERDTSGSDEGKSSLKFNGVTVSQMSKGSGRREFSAQLVRHLQQQAETGKSGSSQRWSHHRLVMDDGQALNVSVRQLEGAMHLQLSAGNSELNKIIQQHIDEIRQHLQEQMNVEVNLQFQHFGNQQAGSEGNQSSAQQEPGGGFLRENRGGLARETKSGRTTRYLGFNNNEWTA